MLSRLLAMSLASLPGEQRRLVATEIMSVQRMTLALTLKMVSLSKAIRFLMSIQNYLRQSKAMAFLTQFVSEKEVLAQVSRIKVVQLTALQPLLVEGHENSAVYCLTEGKMVALKQNHSARVSLIGLSSQKILALSKFGGVIRKIEKNIFLGEESALKGSKASCSLVALSDCNLVQLRPQFYSQLIGRQLARLSSLRQFFKQYLPQLYQVDSSIYAVNSMKSFGQAEFKFRDVLVKQGQFSPDIYFLQNGLIEVGKAEKMNSAWVRIAQVQAGAIINLFQAITGSPSQFQYKVTTEKLNVFTLNIKQYRNLPSHWRATLQQRIPNAASMLQSFSLKYQSSRDLRQRLEQKPDRTFQTQQKVIEKYLPSKVMHYALNSSANNLVQIHYQLNSVDHRYQKARIQRKSVNYSYGRIIQSKYKQLSKEKGQVQRKFSVDLRHPGVKLPHLPKSRLRGRHFMMVKVLMQKRE